MNADVGDVVEVTFGARKGAIGVVESRIPTDPPYQRLAVLLRDGAHAWPYSPNELRVVEKRRRSTDEACKAPASQPYPEWLNELMDAGLAALDETRYAQGPWWKRLHAALHAVPAPRDPDERGGAT